MTNSANANARRLPRLSVVEDLQASWRDGVPLEPNPNVCAADIMTRRVHCVSPNDALRKAVAVLAVENVNTVPVVEQGRVVGTLSAADLVSEWADAQSADDEGVLGAAMVRDAMTTPATTVSPHATVKDVAGLMAHHRVHQVIVVDEGRVVGVVSHFDVVRWVASTT